MFTSQESAEKRNCAIAIATPTTVNMEQTFIMIKPDGVQRGCVKLRSGCQGDIPRPPLICSPRSLVGEIIARFERKGFKLVALKLATPSREHLEAH